MSANSRICQEREANTRKDKCLRKKKNFIELLRRIFQVWIDMLEDANGQIETFWKNIAQRFKEYTEILYNKDVNIQDIFKRYSVFIKSSSARTWNAISIPGIPSWKSIGIDSISIEVWQATEEESVKVLTKWCQQMWRITQWSK